MYCKLKPARKGETTQKLLCLYQLQLKLLVRWGPLVHQRDKMENSRKNQEISRSITLQRGNAASIIGTLGPQRKLEEYFDVIMLDNIMINTFEQTTGLIKTISC